MQVVFQDPYGSFDPRQKVARLVAEPLHLLEKKPTPAERREMVAHALHEVGLAPADMDKYPHEFSGGQRQRLSIARAIITRPKLVVADEPVSALDVSIRAQILDLFAELNQKLGIAYLFITHDLTVARAITDEVLVMHEGRIVERGKTGEVLDHPQSEAAKALVAAAPDLHRAIARQNAGSKGKQVRASRAQSSGFTTSTGLMSSRSSVRRNSRTSLSASFQIGLGDLRHVARQQLAPLDVEIAELRDGLRAVGLVAELVEIFDDAVDAGFRNAESVLADAPEGDHFALRHRAVGQDHAKQHQQFRRQHRIVRNLAHAGVAIEDRTYLVEQSHRHRNVPVFLSLIHDRSAEMALAQTGWPWSKARHHLSRRNARKPSMFDLATQTVIMLAFAAFAPALSIRSPAAVG